MSVEVEEIAAHLLAVQGIAALDIDSRVQQAVGILAYLHTVAAVGAEVAPAAGSNWHMKKDRKSDVQVAMAVEATEEPFAASCNCSLLRIRPNSSPFAAGLDSQKNLCSQDRALNPMFSSQRFLPMQLKQRQPLHHFEMAFWELEEVYSHPAKLAEHRHSS